MINLQRYEPLAIKRKFYRETYIHILSAAISAQEYRFAREAALKWLAAYPGDLLASLRYAQALLGENQPKQALPVLERIVQCDPEFLEATQVLVQPELLAGARHTPTYMACVLALGGELRERETVATWGRHLWMSREALKRGDLELADQMIRQTLAADPKTALAAVTHLEILEARDETPNQAKRNLAQFYHQRWPNCIQCTLLLADWLMDGGESDQAVALLHQAAAQDIGQQVVRRLWGHQHPYRAMWPEKPSYELDVSIPADVTRVLGWNRLPDGKASSETEMPGVETAGTETVEDRAVEDGTAETGTARGKTFTPQVDLEEILQTASPITPGEVVLEPQVDEAEEETVEVLLPIQEELERVAERLNRPELAQLDGRFPVYVVFSSHKGLQAKYGPEGAAEILAAMQDLAVAVQDCPLPGLKKHWGAMLFLPDDPSDRLVASLYEDKNADPWEFKLALADLDAALAKNGERIGALLIVGGPEVVPFHNLPNPVDDDDYDIPSDNPYATRDENYFIPEWPVGRVPGGAGNDPALLLNSLRRIAEQHTYVEPPGWYERFWQWLTGWIRPHLGGERLSYGYTAAIWRQASLSVLRPIGDAKSMLVSPPLSVPPLDDPESVPHPVKDLRLPMAKLAYFNLHGLVDAVEWYGQKDPLKRQDGPDYPVALRPQDLLSSGQAPSVVLSEACYGGHILEKEVETAMSLKFLELGCQVYIGSTSMTYGSISTPLIAADLLGNSFWSHLRSGLPAGEALRRAKIALAREMDERQGYLDGEDQKTLISFVLYGDPLAQPLVNRTSAKAVLQTPAPPKDINTVCDRLEDGQAQSVPPEVVRYVKHVVAQYLPGMEDANFHFSREHAQCSGSGHQCPTGQLRAKAKPGRQPKRSLVTLSKHVEEENCVHSHYARLTLDDEGRLVKLVVSR
jgi:tetratricopeptide (TPR) repeat protein